jgi:hypothetical protein
MANECEGIFRWHRTRYRFLLVEGSFCASTQAWRTPIFCFSGRGIMQTVNAANSPSAPPALKNPSRAKWQFLLGRKS